MDEKELIKQTLKFWLYKIDTNSCTMEEIRSLSSHAAESLGAIGTVEDFAKFCNKPEQAVRNVINRKVIDKPKRRVYYKFFPFIKNIPDKWLKDK
jgi:hypothetical protein